jgi:ATP-dependent exoDNAse (exonuclease V) beta subunit
MAGRSAAGGATAGGATGNAGAAAGGGPAEKKLRPEHALKAANYMSWIASALMLRSLEGAAPQCGSAGDFGSASDRAGGSAGDRAGGILGNGAPGGGGAESGLALVAIHGVAEYATGGAESTGVAEYAAGNAESTDGAECAADGAEAPAVAGAQPSHAEQPGQPKQGRERGQELKPEREFERERGQELERAQEPKQGRAPEQDLELEREIGRWLAWEYPYQRLAGMPLKVSVTEMSEGAPGARHMLESSDASPYAGMAGFYARAEAAERAAFDAPAATGATATGDRARGQAQEPHSLAVPSFLAAKRQFSKAQIGTFTHLVLERIDFRSVSGIADIDRAIAGMVAGKALLPEQAQAVDRRALMLFFESEAGRLARAASELRRETTFTIKLSAAEYFSLLGRPAGRPDGGSVLLQGSIDCWFQDEGGLTLIDYKTGYFAEADIVSAERSKYRRQIALYALALKRITGLDANRRFICLLESGKCVRV